MTPHLAQEIADNALQFIAADPDLSAGLLGASGAEAGGLRQMAARPEFAVFVLDFLLEDDARVIAFAQQHNIAPTHVMVARQTLSGPEDVWD